MRGRNHRTVSKRKSRNRSTMPIQLNWLWKIRTSTPPRKATNHPSYRSSLRTAKTTTRANQKHLQGPSPSPPSIHRYHPTKGKRSSRHHFSPPSTDSPTIFPWVCHDVVFFHF